MLGFMLRRSPGRMPIFRLPTRLRRIKERTESQRTHRLSVTILTALYYPFRTHEE